MDRRLDHLGALRREVHRHPERSSQEHGTAAITVECLSAAGLETYTGIATPGGVGILHGDQPDRTIAWRVDCDALPFTELLEAPFVASNPVTRRGRVGLI